MTLYATISPGFQSAGTDIGTRQEGPASACDAISYTHALQAYVSTHAHCGTGTEAGQRTRNVQTRNGPGVKEVCPYAHCAPWVVCIRVRYEVRMGRGIQMRNE